MHSQPLLTRSSPDEAVNIDNPFKWRHYEGEVILQSVRWHLRYALSYRDLEEMLAERGLSVDHTTIFRWVQAYAPELERDKSKALKKEIVKHNISSSPDCLDWSRKLLTSV